MISGYEPPMDLAIIAVVVMLVAAVAVAAGLFDRPRRAARRARVVERPVVERPVRERVVERPVVERPVEREVRREEY